MADQDFPDFPEKANGEGAYKVARTTAGAFDYAMPLAGQGLQHLLDRFVGAPLEKRREDWFRLLGTKVQELLDRPQGFDPEALSGNEEFVSTVADATQAAMRTHHEEKREALANAVANAAAGYNIDDVLRGSFISYVDRFSPLHLEVLRLMADPSANEEARARASTMYAGGQREILRAAIPPARASWETLEVVCRDLERAGLMDGGSMMTLGSQSSLLNSKATSEGLAFLKFISPPA